jgi:hypothetical protein
MPAALPAALIVGALVTGLFLMVMGLGMGFFFMFLPALPLLFIGLSRRTQLVIPALALASLALALVAGLPTGVIFLLFLGLPSWYITERALRWRDAKGERQWYSIGLIFTHLTLYACVAVAALTFYYASEMGGVEQMLASSVRQEFADVDDQYIDMLNTVITQWSFLIFSMTVWLWGLALYAHTWFAERMLINQGKAVRPDVTVTSFTMPNWILTLMAICGLASLIGSPAMEFLGKSTLISLLMPYFLLGTALMHRATSAWPNRRFFLFFVYFMVFTQFWPALILSIAGLSHHIKRLSGKPTSSRS